MHSREVIPPVYYLVEARALNAKRRRVTSEYAIFVFHGSNRNSEQPLTRKLFPPSKIDGDGLRQVCRIVRFF